MVNTRMEARLDEFESRAKGWERSIRELTGKVGVMETQLTNNDSRIEAIRLFMVEMQGTNVGRPDRGKTPLQDSGGQGATDEAPGVSRTAQGLNNGGLRKLELPIFSGDDPTGWLFRAKVILPLMEFRWRRG